MAESSIFWNTNGTGDGAALYTQAQINDWLRRTFISDHHTTEGVLIGYNNALSVTGVGSPLTVATGAAIVYGFPYENTTSVSVPVATPAIGTTGHRLVLRASWAAQTVRLTLLSSADGVAAIPAATQVAGTTWDISLATLTITTGGTITVTDARAYAHFATKVSTEMLDDSAITTAKIASASINDSKIAERVVILPVRIGGDVNDWHIWGTSEIIPTFTKIYCGVEKWTGSATNDSFTITLPGFGYNNYFLPFVTSVRSSVAADIVFDVQVASPSTIAIRWKSLSAFTHTSLTFYWMTLGDE